MTEALLAEQAAACRSTSQDPTNNLLRLLSASLYEPHGN